MCGTKRHDRDHTRRDVFGERRAGRPGRADMRVGDEERQATMDRLAAHFGAGRLTAEELDERTSAAAAATTAGDLAALERDLPRLDGERPRRPTFAGAHVWHLAWIVPVGLSFVH